ncbi:MAG: integrase, partial [Cyanobacteria bacterium MAG COS1_bin_9]|nr:integrase [Cyanobacteria bacterium MAG COS1_bin_9]
MDKSVDKLPPVMAGMDRAEALAFVSRLYDSAQAGAHARGDPLLVIRFLNQCSRTAIEETRHGY